MSDPSKLTEVMRQHLYIACLQGGGFMLEALLTAKQSRRSTESREAACHKFALALNFLGEIPREDGSGQPPILASEVQAACVNLVSMAADALNPERPTPQDAAFLGVVKPLFGYCHDHAASQAQTRTSAGK